jgi:signal transduction histidine kinase
VFDPFFTTDMQHGMGLGMYLVYNLITQRLGGHIQCESPPGGGVRFHIEIPS